MNNPISMEDRVALITGAGQGVGRQAALQMAEHGAKCVIVNDFNAEKADEVVAEIAKNGGTAIALAGDVCDFKGMEAKMADCVERAGGLHVLVNNAGNAGPGGSPTSFPSFWETDPEDWAPWLQTNLHGVLTMSRLAVPHIIASGAGGSIVNVISDAGRVGEPHLAVYSAAKAGAGGFSRALAKGVGRFNIRVNNVSLASIRTPGVEAMLSDERAVKAMLATYAIRRIGEPADAANMIHFLASDASTWITGQTYSVNGGYAVS